MKIFKLETNVQSDRLFVDTKKYVVQVPKPQSIHKLTSGISECFDEQTWIPKEMVQSVVLEMQEIMKRSYRVKKGVYRSEIRYQPVSSITQSGV